LENICTEVISIKIKRRIRRNPKKEIATFVVLLIIVIIAFIFSLRYLLMKDEPLNKAAHVKTKSLLFTLRMKKTHYKLGEPIKLILEVRNIGSKPIVIKFNESLEYDFLVQREMDLLFMRIPVSLWRYSANRAVQPMRHTITLQPQETKMYKSVWDQKDSSGRQVKAGLYIITGTINIAGKSTELQMRGKMSNK